MITVMLLLLDLQRLKAMSPIGEPVDIVTSCMNDETFSMTLMTTLDPSATSPIVATLRTDSNNQWDFLGFIVGLLEAGHLVCSLTRVCVTWSET